MWSLHDFAANPVKLTNLSSVYCHESYPNARLICTFKILLFVPTPGCNQAAFHNRLLCAFCCPIISWNSIKFNATYLINWHPNAIPETQRSPLINGTLLGLLPFAVQSNDEFNMEMVPIPKYIFDQLCELCEPLKLELVAHEGKFLSK